MSSKFTIELCSYCSFEEMVVDVSWGNDTVAMLCFAKGPEKIEIEIYPPPEDRPCWEFPLKEYLEVLEEAKRVLLMKESGQGNSLEFPSSFRESNTPDLAAFNDR